MSDNGFDLQVRSRVQNKDCYLNLVYYPWNNQTALDLEECIDAFQAQVVPSLLDTMSTTAQIISLKGTLRGTPFSGRTFTKAVSLSGTLTGDCLPAWVTASYRKWPDDASQIPANEPLFKPGRMSISGIPESAQVDGVPTASYKALVATFCVEVLSLSILSIADTITLTMDREVNSKYGFSRVKVGDVDLQRIGSQMTRKS